MSAYEKFAYAYDLFMQDVPYENWVTYIHSIWEAHGLKPSIVLDLCAGTGECSIRFAQAGISVISVDVSSDMLSVAKNKADREGLDILFLCQDMRELELYGTVDACVCLCDSLNYLLEERELLRVFQLICNYLNPGGLFIFDLNTEHKFMEIGDSVIVENFDSGTFIWENFYDKDCKINQYDINCYVKLKDGHLYERFEETHFEKAYDADVVARLLMEAGFAVAGIYDAFTFKPPNKDSERITFVAMENLKVDREGIIG